MATKYTYLKMNTNNVSETGGIKEDAGGSRSSPACCHSNLARMLMPPLCGQSTFLSKLSFFWCGVVTHRRPPCSFILIYFWLPWILRVMNASVASPEFSIEPLIISLP